MDCSGRYVFFPVRKTGFCLSHSRGCLDGGEFGLNLFLCSCAGFGLRYLIPLFVQAKFLAFDTGTFWDTILLWCCEIVAADDNGWDENDLMGKMRWSRQHMAGEGMVLWRFGDRRIFLFILSGRFASLRGRDALHFWYT